MPYYLLSAIEGFVWGRPISNSLLVLAVVLILAYSLFLYRHADGLKKGLRFGLVFLRIMVLLLVGFVLLEPTVILSEDVEQRRRLPVLVDVSESMSLRDQRKRPNDIVDAAYALGFVKAPKGKDENINKLSMGLDDKKRNTIASSSRLNLAQNLLTGSGNQTFDSLSKDLDIEHHTFGESKDFIGKREAETLKALNKLQAKAKGTSIADSLEAMANDRSGAPLAGIVLMSDGIETTTTQNMETVINNLGIRGIPVYTVGIGLPEPDDVSIRSVIMQDVAFTGDTVPIRVQIRSKGYEKRQVELTLKLNGSVVKTETVDLRGGLQYEDIAFDVRVNKKGAAKVELSIKPFADEATGLNNKVERTVRIVNEKINVLCIEGSARWEYRYLRAILKRDPRINVTFIATHAKKALSQVSSEYIERFPEDPEEAFKYDLVILGDVDSKFFSPKEIGLLEKLVRERGGSLLMLAGRHFSPSSYAGTPVENMLPVTFEADAPWTDIPDGVHPVLTGEGRSNLVMNLEVEKEKNDRVWNRVKPLDQIPALLRARPGATVLAELSNPDVASFPLISWQRYGTGKCLLLGTDRLWLLRYKTGDKYHWRVWSQMIQFLTLSRLMGEHKRIRLETDRSTYSMGDQARIYANVMDDAYEPIIQSGFDVYVGSTKEGAPQPQSIRLRPAKNKPGQYEGYFSPPAVGRYRLELQSDEKESANTIEFQVADVKPEMARTEMQREGLQKIADLSGGKYLEMRELQELTSLVNRSPKKSNRLTHRSLWDHWLVILLIIMVVGSEWIIRRRRDLT